MSLGISAINPSRSSLPATLWAAPPSRLRSAALHTGPMDATSVRPRLCLSDAFWPSYRATKDRRFEVPCFSNSHSPTPRSFSPVLSSHGGTRFHSRARSISLIQFCQIFHNLSIKILAVYKCNNKNELWYSWSAGKVGELPRQFTARFAETPLQALHNFAVSITAARLVRVIAAKGLDPYFGFLHDGRKPGRYSLAWDAIERGPISAPFTPKSRTCPIFRSRRSNQAIRFSCTAHKTTQGAAGACAKARPSCKPLREEE